jgi:hypothetical protein
MIPNDPTHTSPATIARLPTASPAVLSPRPPRITYPSPTTSQTAMTRARDAGPGRGTRRNS